MSDYDDEDPYSVSSEEDEEVKGPPPRIPIEERSTDLVQIKEALAPKEEQVKDENTLKEIEELRQQKANELKAMKADFEAGKITTAEGVQKQAEEITGLDKSTLSSFKDKFENLNTSLDESLKEKAEGTNISDELSQIRSLKEKKADWENCVAEAQNVEKRSSIVLTDELEVGKVKSNLEKLKKAAENGIVVDEEKLKELESFSPQVNDMKNKWKTGDVEKAEERENASKREELEELKRAGVKVKERFHPLEELKVQKSFDASELLGSTAADARKSFIEGSAFSDSAAEKATAAKELEELKFSGLNSFRDKFEKGSVDEEPREKTPVEQLDIQLGTLKQTFEKPEAEMTVDERAEKKKREIEEEFMRFKMVRNRRKQQQDAPTNNMDSAEVDAIKNRFDSGDVFSSPGTTANGNELDVEAFKNAGKAREKFKKIELRGAGAIPLPRTQGAKSPSKWDKKEGPAPEIVNRRITEEVLNGDDDLEAFNVKSLTDRFRNIEKIAPKQIAGKLEEVGRLRSEAASLRNRFEQSSNGNGPSEGKRKQLEEEFAALRAERERAQKELEEERAAAAAEASAKEEDVQVAADHASKMTAKWEKITAKEAKKAEKSKMPQKEK